MSRREQICGDCTCHHFEDRNLPPEREHLERAPALGAAGESAGNDSPPTDTGA